MQKKASVELSANFLVNLIFGIVLFVFGLFIISKMIPKDVPYEPPILELELERCVSSGEKVCMLETSKDLRVGEADYIKLIVNNILDKKSNFLPAVTFSRGVLDDKTQINIDEIIVSDWTLEEFRVYEIENNDHQIVDIPVQVPSGMRKGYFVFNVKICFSETGEPINSCSGESQYNPVLQFTINVK
jgi:hypothetical protein